MNICQNTMFIYFFSKNVVVFIKVSITLYLGVSQNGVEKCPVNKLFFSLLKSNL